MIVADVRLYWSVLEREEDPRWQWSRVLYAYLGPRREILYIGKVDYSTVRERWRRSAKAGFWDDLERERGIYRHVAIVGDVELEDERRLSVSLLGDIESLLIHRLQPWGNIQATRSRVVRPGLRVRCTGAWPLREHTFDDE